MIITLIKCRCIEDQEGDENKESYQLTYFLKLDAFWNPTPEPRRKGLLIIGHGRSGTSFVSKMFANGLRIYEVYEPLRYHNLTDDQKLQVFRAFITCNFPLNRLWQSSYFPPFWQFRKKFYVTKPREHLACTLSSKFGRNCYNTDKLLEALIYHCSQHDSTVVKELTTRIPKSTLSSLVPLLSDPKVNADIRLLHVVRDPRASINSRIKLRWFPDYKDPSFERRVRNFCDSVVENIKFGRALNGSLKDKYKLIFYKDVAARPFELAKEIYDFAQMKMSKKTLQWVVNMTNPMEKRAAKEFNRPYSLVRNSSANIDKWRSQSPPQRIRIIERACKPLLEFIEKLS
ncbi:carbohydrate sulfotransferase 3-like isoform X2 [Acropora palmata]|uniref:carbohydrate sulfotransferase 3-like isoform X2 n=1 Tax=Acropora palmata TaxID=6131 RepID=UPI003DA1C675